MALGSFYTPWKQNIFGILIFIGGTERDQWREQVDPFQAKVPFWNGTLKWKGLMRKYQSIQNCKLS